MENGQQVPRSVYRRRRIAAVVAGLLAVALMVAGVFYVVEHVGGWVRSTFGDEAAPTQPSVTPSVPPTTGAAYADCAAPALVVTITPGADSVPAGTAATFTIAITNSGATDCVVDAGEAFRQVLIVSGSDRIWASTDCSPADSLPRTLLLAPGMTDTTQLAWNRERSAEGCPAGLPAPLPGTYQASVSLAGASGGPVVFQLG
jgi:hypothetical protein